MLPRHARCVFSRLCCNGHSLLLSSYRSWIGRIENPSCSSCGHLSQDTFYLILHCSLPTLRAARSLATLYLFTTSGPNLGELPGFKGFMVFGHAPIPRKGRVTTTTQREDYGMSTKKDSNRKLKLDFSIAQITSLNKRSLLTETTNLITD